MILSNTLKYLASQKLKDAETLYRHGRNSGAVYLMGYAIEFSLKRKLSHTLGFNNGFPENPTEFGLYTMQINQFHAVNTGIQLTRLRQIKTHLLGDLLTFSGAETRVVANCYPEWLIVKTWNPEDRYVRRRISRQKAAEFLRSARRILREIV